MWLVAANVVAWRIKKMVESEGGVNDNKKPALFMFSPMRSMFVMKPWYRYWWERLRYGKAKRYYIIEAKGTDADND